MKQEDIALTCSNPRLISAIYFGLLSVVGTILINAFLTIIGIEEKVPLFASLLIGMGVSSLTGAVFGEHIIHCPRPYKLKTFLTGFIMVIASLPLWDLGFVYFMIQKEAEVTVLLETHNLVYFYLYILAYSYLFFGVALAVCSGFAAMFLRGQLVYDLLAAYQPDSPITELPDSPIERNIIEHSDSMSIKSKK